MLGARSPLRYLLWLALGTLAMALAMAFLLAFELAQKRAIEQRAALQSDSLTALVFQFEREFLRLRHTLELSLAGKGPLDSEGLALRYDIFLSRVALLRDNPSIDLLSKRPEYQKVMPRLQVVVADLDYTLSAVPLRRVALQARLQSLNDIGQDVQAMTLAANSEIARLVERQNQTLLEQSTLIVKLSIAQLLMLVVAAAALVMRHQRQEAERLALERLTEELREARRRAESASRGKSQFLANMSHELRTPFNGLMGMLGLLAETPVTAQQADYLATAQGSARHLLMLLNDILDVSALEAGKLTLQPVPTHLPPLLQSVNALMQVQARSKGLQFAVYAPDLTAPWVVADEVRLKQVLFNLISNAIKFTEQGQVVLHVLQRTGVQHAVETVFEVVDTGIGMDASEIEQLFQRFFQGDSSVTRKFGGTGLGLEISQALARRMRGEITVRSELGKGASFALTVPLPPCAAPADKLISDGLPAAEQATVALDGARILVVEDHPINQKLVGLLLSRLGCQTVFADNGQRALDQVQRAPFDVILMDVNMPVMDGLTATRLIRALPGAVSRTPIVVFTADVMNEAQQQARDAGADDFLSKPVSLAQLRAVLHKHLPGDAPAG